MRVGKLVIALVLTLLSAGLAVAQLKSGHGNIDVRSSQVGGRVYIDNEYKGDADIFIEDVKPGEHVITVRQGGQTLVGQFILKSNETMMLEARFDEHRIVDLKDIAREEAAKRAEAERKVEAERKAEERKKKEDVSQAKTDVKKKPEQKKVVVAAVPKPYKGSEDDRRNVFLNIIRVDIADAGVSDLKVTQKINTKTVTNYNDSKNVTGKIFRSKQNDLLCESGSCSRDWNGRFFYIDESGKRDAFLIRLKETVFTGVTQMGTSRMDMDLCLNGECKSIAYTGEAGKVVQSTIDRYLLSWTKTTFIIRRADLAKEITDAGGTIPEF